jgi:hypothetical protein
MNIETVKAINYLVPGANFISTNGVMDWKDERPQPTQEQIEEVIPLLEDIEKEKAELEKEKFKKSKRNGLLLSSDWTVLPHSPLSEEKVQEWIEYRQELRDFTNQENWVELEFPSKPS